MPEEFLALSLVDCANSAVGEGAELEHPFDNDAGKRQLERWLTDHDCGDFTYAVSAAAALPYISSPRRDRLLSIALDHASAEVRLEAAYACRQAGS